MVGMLSGKRALITHASAFMGPALCEVFEAQGAVVVASDDPLTSAAAVDAVVRDAGPVDVLVANLAVSAPSTAAPDVDDAEWRHVFECLVDPLPRLLRAIAPSMIARGGGAVLVVGSASALRGMRRASTYSAARGAQLAWVQAVGTELARDGIRINAIAQNFVDNPTYFPPEVQSNPKFRERLAREVPLGRLVSPQEQATFAAYLCSAMADCFVGQVFPLSGGWVTR